MEQSKYLNYYTAAKMINPKTTVNNTNNTMFLQVCNNRFSVVPRPMSKEQLAKIMFSK